MIAKTIIYVSDESRPLAEILARELGKDTEILRYADVSRDDLSALWFKREALIYIGAVGIAVRHIAPLIKDKYIDPAVIAVDTAGKHAIPLLAGHIGGGNELSRIIAGITGAEAVITTCSDNKGLWPLDTLDRCMGWQRDPLSHEALNEAVFRFVNGRPTLLYLDIRDQGTAYLERSCPPHVSVMSGEIDWDTVEADLIITVGPRILPITKHVPVLNFRPPCLHLGMGCRKQISPEGVADYITGEIIRLGFSPLSIKDISSIDIKRDEPAVHALSRALGNLPLHFYKAEILDKITTPNPSDKVREVTGAAAVSEAAAVYASGGGMLCIEKQKAALEPGGDFTFALALNASCKRGGHIEIVGAGPGDPELISVRGQRFIETADLILYAGSLIPRALVLGAKKGCVVRSSADMSLEEQFRLMYEHYRRGHLIVRLHTGDPCIYGAVQEQMALFDRYALAYHLTPGISSFQAAAAALRAQFTIPEEVQSIILTRGEGRTPMPEREQIRLLARSQSTMCIFLSATLVDDVQQQLLEEYPPETPVAVCHKLTWPQERIFRGRLNELAALVKENHLTLTTLLVVGKAIENRQGLSRLYDAEFKHLYRR